MRGVLTHARCSYIAAGAVLLTSIILGVVFGTPVWASWTVNPPPEGFENVIIYDTTLIWKNPALSPSGVPYVGWAVGQLSPAGGAVILYYNGSSWSRVFSDENMSPLRSVSARYNGSESLVLAVGDFTLGDTSRATQDYNTILLGVNNVFRLQVFQGPPDAPEFCDPVTENDCVSWVGGPGTPVNLTAAALTPTNGITRVQGGLCDNDNPLSPGGSFGAYVFGDSGVFKVGRGCYAADVFQMFAFQDGVGPSSYFGTSYWTRVVGGTVTGSFTAAKQVNDMTLFLASAPDVQVPGRARLHKWINGLTASGGFSEITVTGAQLNGRIITGLWAVQEPGNAGNSRGSPWHVYMTTADAVTFTADSGVVYAKVSGDASSGLTAENMTRIATSAAVKDVAAAIQYRGGNIVTNADYQALTENNSSPVPNGWFSGGSEGTLRGTAHQTVTVVNAPAPGPESPPSGKAVKLETELGLSDNAAIRFFTNKELTLSANPPLDGAINSIQEGKFQFDATALFADNTTNSGSRSFRISGFLGATPGTTYAFRMSKPSTSSARFFIDEKIDASDGSFATPRVDLWNSGATQSSGADTFAFSVAGGAEIPDTSEFEDKTPGQGITVSDAMYPFVIEYYAPDGAAPGQQLVLEWRELPSGAFVVMPGDRLDIGNRELYLGSDHQVANVLQFPQTRGKPGQVYHVSGYYRVAAAPQVFWDLPALDPRRPRRGWGGPSFRCNEPGNAFGGCGYDWNMYVDPKVETDTIVSDSDTGGWRKFDFILTKIGGVDAGQMEFACITEYGTVSWCADLQIELVQQQTTATVPQYHIYAVGAAGEVFSTKTETPGIFALAQTQDVVNPLNSISLAAPVKGIMAGENGQLLDLIPGYVRGWGWVGTTTNAVPGDEDPLGWISFSCADVGLCNEHQLTYGVDVLEALPARTVHPFAGAAWFGVTDVNQARELGGTATLKKEAFCTWDSRYICSNAADPSTFCSSRGLGACGVVNRCTTAPSFSSCTVSCASHPLGCSSIGWLSFERNTDPPLSTGRPPCADGGDPPCGLGEEFSIAGTSQTYTATLDEATSIVDGWGRFLTLKSASNPGTEVAIGQGGWVKLKGGEMSDFGGPLYDCANCAVNTYGAPTYFGIQCGLCFTANDTAVNSIPDDFYPFLCTAPAGETSCKGRCSSDVLDTCGDSDGCTTAGDTCDAHGWCNGVTAGTPCFSSDDCPVIGDTCIGNAYDCSSHDTCYQWGVGLNEQTGLFTGFVWSEDVGWIDFSRVRIGNPAWFQALQGNIFSGEDVGDPAHTNPLGVCNATYRITAVGQLVNVCSTSEAASPTSPFEEPFAEDRILPSPPAVNLETIYGSVDLKTILNDGDGDYQPDFGSQPFIRGRYGKIVDLNNPGNFSAFDAQFTGVGLVLDRTIYFYQGDLTLNSGLIKNAPAGQSGNGLIFVNGNLTINGNIQYVQSTVGTLDQLASLGIIVLGDITVHGNVTDMVGALYAPGNPLFGTLPDTIGTEGGKIIISGSASGVQYVHRGLMIARQFVFTRTFGGVLSTPEPAERIIYDGRVVTNAPPGFTTLEKALPTVRQIIP